MYKDTIPKAENTAGICIFTLSHILHSFYISAQT